MTTNTASNSFKDITFGEHGFDQLLDYFKDDLSPASSHLCLLIGKAKRAKKRALKQIEQKSGLAVWPIDANDIIIQNESESRQNIDELLANFDPDEQLLYLQNGSRLSGVYTAHSLSRVKYATPQEKYFIKKAEQTGGLCVVDTYDPNEAGRTIRRAAQSIVNFPPPASGLKKLIWNMKQASLQGSHLENDRPQ